MSRIEDGPLSNEDFQERQRKRKKLVELTDAQAWKAVVRTREGRKVLAAIIVESGFPVSVFFENEARNRIEQGKHTIGAFVAQQVKAVDLALYRLMEDEQRSVEPKERDEDASTAV